MSILCIGEILWDVFEDQKETLAGAPFNVAIGIDRLGDPVNLISAVGQDEHGARALNHLRSVGFNPEYVKVLEDLSTGVAEIHIDVYDNPSYFIPRPAAFDSMTITDEDIQEISAFCPQWIYFGTLTQTSRQNEELVTSLTHRFPGISCFYDLNLRDGHWNFPLVQRLARHATVLKLNHAEAQELFALESTDSFSLDHFCSSWSSRYAIETICITLGGQGCALFSRGKMIVVPGFPIKVVDTVGAGDAFTAGFLHGLVHNWPLAQTAKFANALGSIVASRATAIPDWAPEEVQAMLHAPDHG